MLLAPLRRHMFRGHAAGAAGFLRKSTRGAHVSRPAPALAGPTGGLRPLSVIFRHRRHCASAADVREAEAIAYLLRRDTDLCNRVALAIDDCTALRLVSPYTMGEASRPSMRQLLRLHVRMAIPFVGFGFFDNMIMLTVGEAIDDTFGVTLGISTLAAAGIGQMASDSCGITLQGLIERFADNLGLPDPCLTREQQGLSVVQWWVLVSRVVGVLFGCFLGMFPLLLFPPREPRLVDVIAEKLPTDKRAELHKLVTTRNFLQGEKLLSRGELIDYVFLVQSGRVIVLGRDPSGLDFVVCTIGPGHVFGQPNLHQPSQVELIAQDEDVVVQCIKKDDFLRVTGQAGMDMYESHRSREILVYLKAQGSVVTGAPQAERGTGKTRFFTSLSTEEKLDILECTSTPSSGWGTSDKERTTFFANLPEAVKRDALLLWQHDSRVHRHVKDSSATEH